MHTRGLLEELLSVERRYRELVACDVASHHAAEEVANRIRVYEQLYRLCEHAHFPDNDYLVEVTLVAAVEIVAAVQIEKERACYIHSLARELNTWTHSSDYSFIAQLAVREKIRPTIGTD